jgi:hypothetical protein
LDHESRPEDKADYGSRVRGAVDPEADWKAAVEAVTRNVLVVAIGGEPATGKATLVQRAIRMALGGMEPVPSYRGRYGLIEYTAFPSLRLTVFGRYDGGAYAGADGLSIAAEPDAREFVEYLTRWGGHQTVLFAGDRLFTSSYLRFCQERAILRAYVLSCDSVALGARRASRQATNDDVFQRSKVESICAQGLAEERRNQTPADLEANTSLVAGLLTKWAE